MSVNDSGKKINYIIINCYIVVFAQNSKRKITPTSSTRIETDCPRKKKEERKGVGG